MRRALLAVLVPLLALPACGGDGESSAATPAPERCLARWNSDEAARIFGRHVYRTHDTQRAQVAEIDVPDSSRNIRSARTCAAIFAVPEGDYEYGEVGLLVTRVGWAGLPELTRDRTRLAAIQAAASEMANSTLYPDGRLEAD